MINYVFAFRLRDTTIVDLDIWTPEEFMSKYDLNGDYERFDGELPDVMDFSSADFALNFLNDGEVILEECFEVWRQEIMAYADRELAPEQLSEEERELFVRGWENAGGYTGDSDSPAPWCAPWARGIPKITVAGPTAREWGACWWRSCRDEVEALIEADEAEEE